MYYKKNGFTMIELVFVIVVLGILAAIAVPKLAATRDDAQISKAIADIASIRSAIVSERQSRLIKGDSAWIADLSAYGSKLFMGTDANNTLLMYGISAGDANGGWVKSTTTSYTLNTGGFSGTFTYNPANGTFNCTSGSLCSEID